MSSQEAPQRNVWLRSKGCWAGRAAGRLCLQCGAQLGSLPAPCLREVSVVLKIEQGWRETLAAHSPGLELAARGCRKGQTGTSNTHLLQCFHSVLQVFHFFLHFTGGI